MNKGRQGESLTQRGACFGETSQNNHWLPSSDDLLHDPEIVSSCKSPPKKQRKKEGYKQLRLYLPQDIVDKLRPLSSPIRNAVLAARIRGMDWRMEIDPARLQAGFQTVREACAIVRQALQSSGGRDCPQGAILELVQRLERVVRG